MGNCFACLSSRSIHDAEEEDPCVKVVRVTDGELFEYPDSVYVKDLMFGFEGFAVFHPSTAKQPLPPETELKISEIYYLRPWISRDESENHSDDGIWSVHSCDPSERSAEEKPIQNQERKVKKVRFSDAPIASEVASSGSPSDSSPPTSKELLPQEQGGVVRLKLVMSKKQLSELMATNQKSNALVESIIVPVLSLKSETGFQISESASPTASWRPCLEKGSEVS